MYNQLRKINITNVNLKKNGKELFKYLKSLTSLPKFWFLSNDLAFFFCYFFFFFFTFFTIYFFINECFRFGENIFMRKLKKYFLILFRYMRNFLIIFALFLTNLSFLISMDSKLQSFLPIPPDSDFSIHNIPFGVFSTITKPGDLRCASRIGFKPIY